MNEEEQDFLNALQGKDYIFLRLEGTDMKSYSVPPKKLVVEKSEWMTWEEMRHNFRARRLGLWQIFTRERAKLLGYL